MEKLSGKHFPAAVLKEVNDNMAMEELQQVQELEKELAAQYAAAQRAGEETEKSLAKARTECEKMQSAARANLERAAQWIAEEVVNDKWQS